MIHRAGIPAFFVAAILLFLPQEETVCQDGGPAGQGTKKVPRPSPVRAGENLVKNGGFDDGDSRIGPDGWQRPDGLCSFWIKDPKQGGRVMKFDTNVLVKEFRARRAEMDLESPPPPKAKAPVGHAQRYNTVAAHEGVAFFSDPIPVEPQRRYRLQFDCRVEDKGGRKMAPKVFVVGYFHLKGVERRGYKVYKSCEAGPDWRTFKLDFSPASRSSQVTHMRVMLFPYWPPGVYYFDNVRVEALDLDRKDKEKKGPGEENKEGGGGEHREAPHA
jgi:hypothetical protein